MLLNTCCIGFVKNSVKSQVAFIIVAVVTSRGEHVRVRVWKKFVIHSSFDMLLHKVNFAPFLNFKA